ncbi:pleckstrin homology domain-containing family O member 1b [Brachionichthys hirsutus]|uniref:pleckstrin homology domain-containing family O member 1b n=1 Tax=Brachionichthys hirsutus TaxID=412623 RepID=UPI0036044359
MRRNSGKRGPLDSTLQADKLGWIRKFCGKGVFREIWKNRFVVLRGDQLFICEKEVKEPGWADEVMDLLDFERCEEVKKNKSRSKKNHSRFRLCSTPETTVQNLVFLAVSPEDKESWITVLNAAISGARNRVLDQVMVQHSQLFHPTQHRAKIPHNRRAPTRGHLLASSSSSSSDGTVTLDPVQEQRPLWPQGVHHCDAFMVNVDQPLSHLSSTCPRCTVEDEVLKQSQSPAAPGPGPPSPGPASRAAAVSRLEQLISQRLQRTEQLLGEGQGSMGGAPAEADRLLKEAGAAWIQAHQVLKEVKELMALYQQLDCAASH